MKPRWRLYNVLDGTYYSKLDAVQLQAILSKLNPERFDEWKVSRIGESQWLDIGSLTNPTPDLEKTVPLQPILDDDKTVTLTRNKTAAKAKNLSQTKTKTKTKTSKTKTNKTKTFEVVNLSSYVGHLLDGTKTKTKPANKADPLAGIDFGKIDLREVEKRKIPRIQKRVEVTFERYGELITTFTVDLSPVALKLEKKFPVDNQNQGVLMLKDGKSSLVLNFKPLIREKDLVRGYWRIAMIIPSPTIEKYVAFLEKLAATP